SQREVEQTRHRSISRLRTGPSERKRLVRKHIKQLAPQREKGQHPGLLLTRFLAKNVAGDNGDPEEKRDLFKAACQASRSDAVIALYCLAFKRWRDSAQRLREVAELTTPPHARL